MAEKIRQSYRHVDLVFGPHAPVSYTHLGGRGLPLGARQADDLQLSGGVTVEQVGQGSDGRAHIMDSVSYTHLVVQGSS